MSKQFHVWDVAMLDVFVKRVMSLRIRFPFSVTSWLRTEKHNKRVGGVDDSFHLIGLGLDVILDFKEDKDSFMMAARAFGFDVIDENDHLHIEPSDTF